MVTQNSETYIRLVLVRPEETHILLTPIVTLMVTPKP